MPANAKPAALGGGACLDHHEPGRAKAAGEGYGANLIARWREGVETNARETPRRAAARATRDRLLGHQRSASRARVLEGNTPPSWAVALAHSRQHESKRRTVTRGSFIPRGGKYHLLGQRTRTMRITRRAHCFRPDIVGHQTARL